MAMKTSLKHIALLIIRILVGGFIAWAGIQKLTNMDATIANMATYFNLSPFIVWLVSLGELVGGIAVLLGAWTQIGAALIAIIMAGAIYYTAGKAQAPIYLFAGSLLLTFVGGGKFSVKSSSTKEVVSMPSSTPTL